MFVTVLYGVCVSTGEFLYTRARGTSHQWCRCPGPRPSGGIGPRAAVGIFPDVVLAKAKLTLPPGGSLILYTDGVIETRSPSRTFFGEERLIDLALRARGLAGTDGM